MKKFFKTFSVLSIMTLAFSGFMACSDSGDSGDSGNTNNLSKNYLGTGDYTETSGTVSAPTIIDGKYVSKCTDSNGGVYEFTQPVGRSYCVAADRGGSYTATGEWTYTENGKTIAKFSGKFSGDISSFGTSESELILKVEYVANFSGTMEDAVEEKIFVFNVTAVGKFSASIPNIPLKSDYDSVFALDASVSVSDSEQDLGLEYMLINTYYFKDGNFSMKVFERLGFEGKENFLLIGDVVYLTGTYEGDFTKDGLITLTVKEIIDNNSDETVEKMKNKLQEVIDAGKRTFTLTNEDYPLIPYTGKETANARVPITTLRISNGNLIVIDDETGKESIYIRK